MLEEQTLEQVTDENVTPDALKEDGDENDGGGKVNLQEYSCWHKDAL